MRCRAGAGKAPQREQRKAAGFSKKMPWRIPQFKVIRLVRGAIKRVTPLPFFSGIFNVSLLMEERKPGAEAPAAGASKSGYTFLKEFVLW